MKTTLYFQATRLRSDRVDIRHEWIEFTVPHPVKEVVQSDGRFLRVVLLEDGETIHNAFFD